MKCLKYIGFAVIAILVGCTEKDEIPGTVEKPEVEKPTPPPTQEPDKDQIPEHNAIVGTLCGFEGDLRTGKNYKGEGRPTTYYNVPLFEAVPAGSEDGWWDNLVEELAYSGLDYVAANCRGLQPSYPAKYVDHGDPTRLKELVEAMERRGVTDEFKIAFFDDCPASWEAARNHDLGRGYAQYNANNPEKRKPYPLKDISTGTTEFQDSVYQYIWDYNLKLAFKNVPEKYMLKYNDRPVVYFWGCGFVGDVPGKLAYILNRIREDCKKEFGLDPLLIIDKDWLNKDATLKTNRSDIGGVNDWFNMNTTYTVRTYNDLTVGVGIPGFLVNDLLNGGSGKMFVDSRGGRQLNDALSYCVKYNSDIILIEGFTDVLENAALWRSTDKVYYEYPNQRLNILRKWSSRPYPKTLRVEAEACDYFEDKSSGNSGGQYRKGDLDVKKCDDTLKGWCVTDAEAGESLRWVELPFSAGNTTIKLRYASQAASTIRVDADGVSGKEVQLPSTGGEWKDIDVATLTFEEKGWREVKLNIVSGKAELNYFVLNAQ